MPLWAPQTDSDLDTYPGSIGNTYLAQSSEPNGYIRRNASSGVTLDCNAADADVYANQTVATDSDQDGYGTSAATSQCAGGSTTVGGRTYYKNSAGSYAFIASASMLGLEGFITSYDTPQSDIRAIINDTSNNVLYAGTYPNGIIYRCNFSGIADCDNPGIWTVSYDTTETGILSLIFDPINGVIYAGSDPNGIIYRCAVLTGCDEDTDWTVSYDTTETNIRSLATFYYGGFNYIYAGSYSNGIIYRCEPTLGCDAAGDWTVSQDTPDSYIYSLFFEGASASIFAGTGGTGIIYRCESASGCQPE